MLWLVNIVAFVINVVVVGGSTAGWFGRTNDQVSDDYPTLITPANWAFSIWGLIFLSELFFVSWQAFPSNRDTLVLTEGLGCWFAIACVLQAAWSIAFAQEELIASAVLLCAIAFALGMGVFCLSSFKCNKPSMFCRASFWTVHFPIGLHAGWVLAASLVNINVALELDDVSSETAALILSVVGACFGATIAAVVFYDQVFLLAVAWAVAGIAAKQDYRRERLGKPVADGVDEALKGLWIALLGVGFLGLIAGMRQRNRNALEAEEKQYALSSGRAEGGAQRDLTNAIFSS